MTVDQLFEAVAGISAVLLVVTRRAVSPGPAEGANA